MTHSRHVELQQMLTDRRSQIEKQVQHKVRGFRDAEGRDTQRPQTDLGDDPAQEDIDFALVQMQSQTLDLIRQALTRLQGGDYGICVECDDEIAETRLRALPFATRCRSCQAEQEDAESSRRTVRRDAGVRMRVAMERIAT